MSVAYVKKDDGTWEPFSIGTQGPPGTGVPAGSMVMWPGSSAPTGWLLCGGQVVSQTTYADLYAIVGTQFNTGGEGAGNFRLPDMVNRLPRGSRHGTGVGVVIGSNDGVTDAASRIITHNHVIPSQTDHAHTIPNAVAHNHEAGTLAVTIANDRGTGSLARGGNPVTGNTANDGIHNHGGADAGGSHAHGGNTNNNTADSVPWMAFNFIIKI